MHIRELTAVGKAAGRVDGRAFFNRSPAADRVEFLERQARRIHEVVTGGACRVGAVLSQPPANREVPVHRVVLQCRHVGQRRRWRNSKNILEDPLAAQHRRGPGGIGRDRQNACLAKQPAAPAVFVQRDTPEAAAIHVRDAVMPGEPFVDERVIRPQQVEDAPILAQDAFEEQFRFLPKGLPKIVVEIRKQTHIRRDRREIAQVQPLRGEVAHQGLGTSVRQHPPHLSFEHRRLAQFSSNGHVEQLIVRNTAPQEK